MKVLYTGNPISAERAIQALYPLVQALGRDGMGRALAVEQETDDTILLHIRNLGGVATHRFHCSDVPQAFGIPNPNDEQEANILTACLLVIGHHAHGGVVITSPARLVASASALAQAALPEDAAITVPGVPVSITYPAPQAQAMMLATQIMAAYSLQC